MRILRYLSICLICALLLGAVPALAVPAAAAPVPAAGYSAALKAIVPNGRNIGGWCVEGCKSRIHHGVDVQAPTGSPVYAPEPGVITRVGPNNLGGNTVSMKDDSNRRWYFAHFDRPSSHLKRGQRVARGDLIGNIGMTGNAKGTVPHVHVQVTWPGGDWADPAKVLADWSRSGSIHSLSGPWYRYQGEPSSYDDFGNQSVNCGPTSVAMAIQYVHNLAVPVRDVRAVVGKNQKGTNIADLAPALDKWNVKYKYNIMNADAIRKVIDRGNIALVGLDMRPISPGKDIDGASADPSIRTGRYYSGVEGHWLIVKGVSPDGKYFLVYDGNVWGAPGYAKYWYSNGKPKGLDRWYLASEVEKGMLYNGYTGSHGVEILSQGGPRPGGGVKSPPFKNGSNSTAPEQSLLSVEGGTIPHSRFVTLSLRAHDAQEGVSGMMISNNEFFTDAFEEPYAPTKEWTLVPGDGSKTVYARFKNTQGSWSDPVSIRVQLEEQPPVGVVTISPDPRLLLAAQLSGNTLPAIGTQPKVQREPAYRPLGPNLLSNSSFEAWAGGIPAGWDSPMREQSYEVYDPGANAYHGALALYSRSTEEGSELTQGVVVKPDTEYSLSAQVQGANGTLVVEELQTQGTDSVSLQKHTNTSVGAEGWQPVTLKFRSSSNTTDIRVSLLGPEVRWDALQLQEDSAPTTYRADGVLLEPPATNLLTNPSIERGAEGWTGRNSRVTVISSPDYARSGRQSLLVHKDREGRAATMQAAYLVPGRKYTFSAHVRIDNGTAVTNDLIKGWYYEGVDKPEGVPSASLTDQNRPPMTWQAVGGGWYRGSYSFIAMQKLGLYGLVSTEALKMGDEYYLDAAQLETGGFATSYVDGSLGAGYSWTDAPHASTSSRGKVSLEYGRMHGTEGSLLFWARPEGPAAPAAPLLELGTLSARVMGQGLRVQSGGQTVGVLPWKPGDAQPYAITWSARRVQLYHAGKLLARASVPGPAAESVLTLGPAKGWAYPNAVVGDVSLWRKALPEAEVRYLAGRSPLDPGRERVNDRYTHVTTNAIDATAGTITVEWSDDGENWYPWDQVQGRHGLDMGGEEGTKTVWVRYTDSVGNKIVYSDRIELDLTPPEIMATAMTKGLLSVTFSEPIAPWSLEAATVSAGDESMTGTWSYVPGGTVAIFTPSTRSDAPLTLTIGDTLQDTAGNPIAEPYDTEIRDE